MTISLERLVAAFLERQELPDCRLVFEPPRAGVRRAKRSTVMIKDAKDPMKQPKLQGGGTVQDLLDRFLALSAEMSSWTDGASRRYVLRLYNVEGRLVKLDESLAVVRRFAQVLDEKNVKRVRKLLENALGVGDSLIGQTQVNELAKGLIDGRNGH